ncbi:HD-GYP domain-containing protein [Thiomicrorhabdus sediminis]|uniref:HD domain-containing protein n=1 Tax=Thiomicrorhabdus sediminis TaxID=2580412 RepID=A0A4P9K7E8_9GAMM|nr:HD domain-containing phosphohydrolase [Thiomicrorhabdus sediminis]QCU91015.1 HD domain-containing protein [Thiomicrorhabdus sediminis]
MIRRFQTVSEELFQLHDDIREQWPSIARIAVALYDEQTDKLHTFVKSSPDMNLLNHYSVPLAQVPSLLKLADSGECRVLQNMSTIREGYSEHSKVVAKHFKASYTEPFYMGNKLLGFVFFDADEENYFTESLVRHLHSYSRLIESLIISETLPVMALIGMVNTTKDIANIRDSETGKHLIRVARYTQLIATELADKFDLTDEYIEYMTRYAPLHDIGKVAIPDRILLKPGKLNDEEYRLMQTHVVEGLNMLDHIINNFNFLNLRHVDLLRDVISAHHERWNGSGYPNGLSGEEIPLAGRIVTVADVFDALASDRIYRAALPVDDVFEYLQDQKGIAFDPQCVDAFLNNKDRVLEIKEEFKEDFDYSQVEAVSL